MPFTGFKFYKLNSATKILPFECGDEDLNSFLSNKAIAYKKELLATTYILESEEKTIAYLSIYNDSLAVQEKHFASKSALERTIKKIMDHPKRHLRQFPAIKIGRLAVCKETKETRKGIGRGLVNYVINLALEQNSNCACQLITVDAYSESLDFYTKLGFKFLSEKDKGDDTRQMYLDVRPYMNASEDVL